MWRQYVILCLAVVSCAAIPKTSGKRELQRLARPPRIEFGSPLVFDRTTGFVVFPNESAAMAESAEVLKEAKGTPADAELFLEAARILARGGDVASSIRSYARAADLFGHKVELEPGDASAFIGLSDACVGLGRFAEAQAALGKAELLAPEDADLATARFHQERAWSAFAGEENRFSSGRFINILENVVRRGVGIRIETARRELERAAEYFSRLSEKKENDVPFLRQRAAFRSFRGAMQTAFVQVQHGEKSSRDLHRSLFAPDALADFTRIAELRPDEPRPITVAAFAYALAESNWAVGESSLTWTHLGLDHQRKVLQTCRRLEMIADSGSKSAGEAAELLGCAQVFLINDFAGGQRSFRAALRIDPLREASWDLLTFAIASAGNPGELVQTCEDRATVLPNARSSALLIKSYDRQGDSTRAEWNALIAAGNYPHDFYVNLSLAAVLLKREDFVSVLWRAGDALNKAEKQMTLSAARQNQLDFVLLKSIYLGLSDQTEEAKSLLQPYTAPGRSAPELQDVLRALEF